MVKTIYFYYLALDPMILQVIGAPCMDLGGGHNYIWLVVWITQVRTQSDY
jgi:hypothetical protein